MGAAKRELEEWEETKHLLAQIAVETDAITYNGDTDVYDSKCNADAERHAYARMTRMHKRGHLRFDLADLRDAMRDILDKARFGNRLGGNQS